MIIKPSLNVYDLYDIIDTVLLKHQYVDMIGIATPGMVQEGQQLRNSSDEKILDIKNDFEKKYDIKVFVCNNANAAVWDFHWNILNIKILSSTHNHLDLVLEDKVLFLMVRL